MSPSWLLYLDDLIASAEKIARLVSGKSVTPFEVRRRWQVARFLSKIETLAQDVSEHSFAVLLRLDPCPYERRAFQQFDSSCFAAREKAHRIAIDDPYLPEVECHVRFTAIDLQLQLLQVARFDSSAENERRSRSIRVLFDFQNHVGRR